MASQKLTVFAFADAGHATLDAGEPVTGDAANITMKIEQDDDGTQSASNDVNPTEVEDGQYRFDLTQAETNGDKLTFYPESSTAGVQVVAMPSMVIYTRPANFADMGIETDGHVHADVKEWLGSAPAALTDTDKIQVSVQHWSLASITTDITGNLSGSVGSVTGAVGSVTGNVGGNVSGSVGSISGVTFPTNFGDLSITVTTGLVDITQAAADKAWSTTTRVLTANTNLNDPTAAAIRSEIDSNSTQLAAIVADTNELQGDWANGGRLDLILDELTSQGDTNEGKLDAITTDLADGTVVVGALNSAAIADVWSTDALTEAYASDGAAFTPAQGLYMIWSAVAEFAISGTTITAKKLDGTTTAMTFTLDDGTDPTSRTRAT